MGLGAICRATIASTGSSCDADHVAAYDRYARQPVAAQDAGKGRAEQLPQDIRAATSGDGMEYKRGGDHRPGPAFRAVHPVAGLIRVEHGLVRQRVHEVFIGRCDGRTRLFPCLLRTSHADRNLQRAFEQALHNQAQQGSDTTVRLQAAR